MDVPAALRSLDLSREDDVPDLAWLAQSQLAPAAFWTALVQHVGRVAPALESRPPVTYDLYRDSVTRHAAGAAIALVEFDQGFGWRSLSYADLAARSSACARVWAEAGVRPGAVVALVMPLGAPWLIAFAAALRLGLVVSFLTPAGDLTLAARLDALAPSFVVYDAVSQPPPLGRWADKAIAAAAGDGRPHAAPPHAYAPAEPCARLFSPLRAPLARPVALGAEAAWQSALRDAVFVYRLAPGDGLALPGFPPQQHHPAAIFAALLAGATFVHVSSADVADRPALLKEKPIATLGVSPELRDVLRQKPVGALPSLRQWIKSVDEPLDWTAWKDFVVKNELEKSMAASMLVDAAAGGALLFSTRRPGSVNAYVVPGAGRPYGLVDAASSQPAAGSVGVFVPGGGDPSKDGWFLLAGRGPESLWASTLAPRRAGRVFPAAEVESFVGTLPGVRGATTVPVPTGDPGGRWAFVLVVFGVFGVATEESATHGEAIEAIESAIRERLSGDHVPDRLFVVALHPRTKGGKVDGDWCARQYSSGLLAKKAASPVFRHLALLRGIVGA